MEQPLCKLCGSKHWPREPHVWLKFSDLVDKPIGPPPKVVAKARRPFVIEEDKAPKKMAVEERARIVEQDDGTAVFVRKAAKRVLEKSEWDDCPRCKARMEKQVAANRRYREKRRMK